MNAIVIQLGTLGDMILTTPVFRAIKHKYPDAKIDVVAGRRNQRILANNPLINKVFIHNKSPLKLIPYIFRLRARRYDWLIDHKDHISKEGRLLAKIIRADKKVGYNNNEDIYDYTVPSDIENEGRHFVERAFNALEPLGIDMPEETPRPEIYPGNDADSFADKFINDNNLKHFIIINLSAGSKERILPAGKWLQIIDNSNLSNFRIVLNSMPEQYPIRDEILKKRPDILAFPARDIMDLCSIVRKSRLVVTPDTSLVHIAAAFDVPLVGLFAELEKPINKLKFMPLSSVHRVIWADDNDITKISAEKISEAISSIIFNIY